MSRRSPCPFLAAAALAAGLAALSVGPGAGQEGGREPSLKAYNSANRHHYEVIRVPGGIAWFDAVQAAARRAYLGAPGHLATLTTSAEQQFVLTDLYPVEGWIGAYQDRNARDFSEPAGGWRWVTGEPWTFAAWNEKEPNNAGERSDVACFWSNGNWNDTDYSLKNEHYVVEYDTAGPDATRPGATAAQEIEQLLGRVLQRSRGLRSYAATAEFSVKAHGTTLGGIRAQLTIQPPNRFRLEGRGNNGSIVAIADGRQFLMARTYPRDRMRYLVKRSPGLPRALQESFSLLIDTPLPPGLSAFATGTADPRLWSAAGRIGPLTEGEPREQALHARVAVRMLGEDPAEGEAKLVMDLDSGRPAASEISFRYKGSPLVVREAHVDVRVNEPVPADRFAFTPTRDAIRVDDLGEQDPEVEYSPLPRR